MYTLWLKKRKSEENKRHGFIVEFLPNPFWLNKIFVIIYLIWCSWFEEGEHILNGVIPFGSFHFYYSWIWFHSRLIFLFIFFVFYFFIKNFNWSVSGFNWRTVDNNNKYTFIWYEWLMQNPIIRHIYYCDGIFSSSTNSWEIEMNTT